MPRHLALLRAINVGGHTVKMDRLRALFEDMAFSNVETFIASGNVFFDAKTKAAALERRIEQQLAAELGYDVATFVRAPDELTAVVEHEPFPKPTLAKAHALWVAFLKDSPSPDGLKRLKAIQCETDAFAVQGREVFWLRQVTSADSKVTGATVERALGAALTARNITTVRKLADLSRS